MNAKTNKPLPQEKNMLSRTRRKLAKIVGGQPNAKPKQVQDFTKEKKVHEARKEHFNAEAARMGKDVDHFTWYHVIDLGNGLVTPGDYDYRDTLPAFHFPADMRGMKVLDVGSATGFFAFEFERRGADVVSVDLPSLDRWDMSHVDRDQIMQSMMNHHHVTNLQDLTYRHLHGPFGFCAEMLGSKVRRVYSTIYELTPEKLGETQFDLIFLGDVLLHLFAPLTALDVLSSLCRGTLVITCNFFESAEDAPYLYFGGNLSKDGDSRTWWRFNQRAVEEMLLRVGFKNVEIVDTLTSVRNREWRSYHRKIIHATK